MKNQIITYGELQEKLNELNTIAPIYREKVRKVSMFIAAKSYKLHVMETRSCGLFISLRGDNGITSENACPVAHSYEEMAKSIQREIDNINSWLNSH